MIDYEKLSKDCSYILRHAADDYFLTSDSQGWVDLKEFINVLNLCFGWNTLNELDINVMIAQSKKKRHEIVDGRIRAMYGHSIKQKIIYEEREPPSFLYHGTEEKNIIPILKYGLEKQRRQYVHLTNDYNIAYYSAIRKNKKITVIKIRSKAAWKDGIKFYQPEIGVWLADYIPSKYLVSI
ncbi:TPA: RNA 2'-phosphotransferase [Streptococcus suis]|nr:RNA 2'-phosphotransferase [Streptococcus suis]